MSFLPWTDWLFQQLPRMPILLPLLGAAGVFVIGFLMYRTSPDMSTEDILGLLPRMIIAVTKHLNWGKVLGLFLILLGGLATVTFADEANAVFQAGSGTGSPAIYQCLPPFTNLACWTSGTSSGAVSATNSTLCTASSIGTSGCPLPQNGCDGVLRGYGRCETGTATCTVAAGGISCSTGTIAFPTPFTNTPQPLIITPISPGITVPRLPTITVYFLLSTTNVTWSNMPAADTNFLGSNSGAFYQYIDASYGFQYKYSAECPVASVSVTGPKLVVQYSNTGGTTWVDLPGNTPLVIDGVGGVPGNCGTGIPSAGNPGNIVSSGNGFAAFPVAAQNATLLIRLIGRNGNGAGDNPQFQWVRFDLETAGLQSPPVYSQSTLTVTSTSILGRVPFPATVSSTLTLKWTAISRTG